MANVARMLEIIETISVWEDEALNALCDSYPLGSPEHDACLLVLAARGAL